MTRLTGLTIDQARESIAGGILPKECADLGLFVEKERSSVEKFLACGGRAYGFSTYFGHLDHESITLGQTYALLESQIVGNAVPLSTEAARCIVFAKIAHVAAGGTGLSRTTFNALLSAFRESPPASTDLNASYGSGDVAAAALFWNSTLFESKIISVADTQPGDIIGLVNGNFMSLGLALYWVLHRKNRFLEVLESFQHSKLTHIAHQNSDTQLSVSLRDKNPLIKAWISAVTALELAVTNGLNSKSANPLFEFDESGKATPRSNSSFLNFELHMALTQMRSCILLLCSYLLGEIRFATSLWEKHTPEPEIRTRFIQYPKVAKSYCQDIESELSQSSTFAQAESNGIEDISDGNLKILKTLLNVEAHFEYLVELRSNLVSETQSLLENNSTQP